MSLLQYSSIPVLGKRTLRANCVCSADFAERCATCSAGDEPPLLCSCNAFSDARHAPPRSADATFLVRYVNQPPVSYAYYQIDLGAHPTIIQGLHDPTIFPPLSPSVREVASAHTWMRIDTLLPGSSLGSWRCSPPPTFPPPPLRVLLSALARAQCLGRSVLGRGVRLEVSSLVYY